MVEINVGDDIVRYVQVSGSYCKGYDVSDERQRDAYVYAINNGERFFIMPDGKNAFEKSDFLTMHTFEYETKFYACREIDYQHLYFVPCELHTTCSRCASSKVCGWVDNQDEYNASGLCVRSNPNTNEPINRHFCDDEWHPEPHTCATSSLS